MTPDATQSFTLTVARRGPGDHQRRHHDFTVGHGGHVHGDDHRLPDPALTETGALPIGVTFVDNGDGTATLAGTPAAGTDGPYALTITAANGVGPDATQSFTLTVAVAVAPTVTLLDPNTGPEAGGTPVTITGTGFTGATEVDFDTTAATDLVVVNDTTITATSPAGTGTVDVTVTTPGGTSAIVPEDTFTYTAAISPYVHIVGDGNPDQFTIEEDGMGNVDFSVNGVVVTSQPANTIVQAFVSNTVGGNTLTVDSSNGLVAFTGTDPNNPTAAHQINFDGGPGGGSILELRQTGGSVADTDTYTPGPIPGSGISVISGGGSVQTVSFVNLAPVFDFVPATTLTVNANNADNAITYAEGFFPPGVLNPTWVRSPSTISRSRISSARITWSSTRWPAATRSTRPTPWSRPGPRRARSCWTSPSTAERGTTRCWSTPITLSWCPPRSPGRLSTFRVSHPCR